MLDLEKYSIKGLANNGLPIYIFGTLKKNIPKILNYLTELQLKCNTVFIEEDLPQDRDYSYVLSICKGLGINVSHLPPAASLFPIGVIVYSVELYERKKWVDFFSTGNKHFLVDAHDLFAYASYIKCEKYFLNSDNLLHHCRSCPASYGNCPIREYNYKKQGLAREKAIEQLLLRCGFICNYACEGCNQFIPYYTEYHKKNFNSDDIINDLCKVAGSLQYINNLWLEGGEAMLWEPLPELINKAVQLDNIGSISILTNGSYIPRNEVLNVISENRERMLVHINAYKVNQNLTKIFSIFERYRIKYYLRDERSNWADFRDTSFKKLSVSELSNIRKRCHHYKRNYNRWILNDGKLFAYCCITGYLTHYLNKYDELSKDHIDIRKIPETNLLEEMDHLYDKSYLDTCNYCALASKTVQDIDVAMQIKQRKI